MSQCGVWMSLRPKPGVQEVLEGWFSYLTFSSRSAQCLFCVLFLLGLGYDPYNPELPQPPVQRENGALGQGDGMLELELVNQAIEAVRGEVELLETARGHSAGASALAPCSPATHMDDDSFSLALTYTPGGLLSPDSGYQPTPLAAPAEPGHKYSLAPSERAQGRAGGGTGALEYVPKAVGQPRRCGRPVPGGKYVVDSSKPSTDLEYDPLSNFSARHLDRASARDERATKRPRGSRGAEPYTPALKKPCDPFGGCEARFSDSEDDVASPPKADVSSPRAGTDPGSRAPGKPSSKECSEPGEGGLRVTKEMAVQCDVEDLGQPPKAPDTVSLAKLGSLPRASQDAGVPKEGKVKKKKSGTPASISHKDKARKKDKKKDKDPARARGKDKVCEDKRTPQAGSPRGKTQGPEGTKKKPSSATTVASSGKGGLGRPSSGGPKDSGPGSHAPLAWKGGSARKTPSGKLVERKARSLDEGAPQDTPKLKKRALSHAELFGDESEEEDSGLGVGAGAPRLWPPTLPSLSSDSESDSDSSLGLGEVQVPKCLKAVPPASPAPPSPSSSSSSGASQCAEEAVDYSALEKEVDFDADPMEECLRIFNESTSVKTEDKGRLARQVRALALAGEGPARGHSVPQPSPADSSLCDPGRSRSFSTGLLTPFKIQEPSVAACCPPAPCPEQGCWLSAHPAGSPWQRPTDRSD